MDSSESKSVTLNGAGQIRSEQAAANRSGKDWRHSLEPILVDTATACGLLSIKRTLLFQYLRAGVLVRRKAGRKTLVTMESIKALAEQGAA